MRKRSRLWALLLSLPLLTAMVSGTSAGPSSLRLLVNGRELFMPAPVVIRESRVLVPMRAYLESLGATVQWQPPDAVTARLKGRVVQMQIGATTALVDGRPVSLDVPAQIIDDRTYLPLRFLSEGLGATVAYDGKAVTVTTGGQPQVVVIDGPLNVRQTPTTTAPILTTLPNGTVLDLVQQDRSWSQVKLSGGAQGWVANQFTRAVGTRPLVEPFEPVLAQAEGFLQVAGECLGVVPMINDRLHIPVRQTVERLGGSYAAQTGQVEVRLRTHRLLLTPGEREAQLNGKPHTLTSPPVVVGGQVLMPIRPFAEALGVELGWNERLRTATLGAPTTGVACNPALALNGYIVMDAATGLVLSEYRSRERFPVASTTKVMTAILAVEQANQDAVVTVSRNASVQPGASVYLRQGEQRTVRELLWGLMLVSGNDAATAIAEHLAGTEAAFAQAMNRRAAELGAVSTQFLNASGLDDWNNPYSTARDLAVITRHGLQNPDFRVYMSAAERSIGGPTGTRVLKNKNEFVHTYTGATGVKNGWTEKANHTLVASAFRGERELIVVVLGAPTRTTLYQQAQQLMDHGFRQAGRAWLLQTDK